MPQKSRTKRADAQAKKFRFTKFKNVYGMEQTRLAYDLDDLAKFIQEASAPSKEKLPRLVPAVFGDVRLESKSLRHRGNIQAITGIVCDYDGDKVAMQEGAAVAKKAKLEALFHTSPTPGRWHALFMFDGEHPWQDYHRLYGRLDTLYGGIFEKGYDGKPFTYGRIHGQPGVVVITTKGRRLDAADDLPEPPPRGEAKSDKPTTGRSFEDFKSALMSIPNDKEWGDWRAMLCAIKHEAGDDPQDYLELAHEWSNECTRVPADPDYTESMWEGIANGTDNDRTGWSVFYEAGELGWIDPEMTAEALFPDDVEEDSYADPNFILIDNDATEDFLRGMGVKPGPKAKTTDTSSWAQVWGRPKYGATPETQWLLGTTYARKFVTGIIAPGGRGKSALMMVQALAAATGKPLLKDEPPRQGPINAWLVNLEEDQIEIERRLEAICIHYEITNEQIGDRLRVNGSDMSLIIATEKKGDFTIHTPIVDAVMKTIRDNETDIMYVDPFVSSHAVSENDNTKIDAVAKTWRRIAVDCDCGIGIAHHIRKPKSGQGDVGFGVDDMRGASALPDALRRVFALNAMTPAEAENFGIEEGERFRYFHVDGAKQNYVRPSSVRIWRKLESVHLGNAVKFGGDWRQVATAWEPPAVDDMTPEEAEKIIEKIKVGEWRADTQAETWVGKAIAEILEWDPKDPDAKKSIKAILAKWIKAGALKVVTRNDAKSKPRKFVIVNIVSGADEIVEEEDENE